MRRRALDLGPWFCHNGFVERKKDMSKITKAREQEGTQQFVNRYRCPSCGYAWDDIWDSACNDLCPQCDKEIEPYESKPIRDGDSEPIPHGSC
jgi:rubrerythrin